MGGVVDGARLDVAAALFHQAVELVSVEPHALARTARQYFFSLMVFPNEFLITQRAFHFRLRSVHGIYLTVRFIYNIYTSAGGRRDFFSACYNTARKSPKKTIDRMGDRGDGISMMSRTAKRKPRRSPFAEFGARLVPRIDGVISRHFDRKARGADGLRRDIFLDLKEYCTREGKRIRPLLLLLACGEYRRAGGAMAGALGAAAALELMHSFLLVQDDIIDRSDLRRGQKTLHVVAGEKYAPYSHNAGIGGDVALVMADILMTGALELVASADFPPPVKGRFLRIFAETYERTAYGQILDILYSRPRRVCDLSVPREIGTEKTAYYTMVYPLMMGYVLSGGTAKKEMDRIRDFALPLGLAFQTRDDILGVYGGKDATGKPSDSDLVEGKFTFLVAHTLQNLDRGRRREFMELFNAPEKTVADVAALRGMMDATGALEKSRERLAELTALSRARLERLAISRRGLVLLEGLVDLTGEA